MKLMKKGLLTPKLQWGAKGWFFTSLGATPGVLKLHLRAFEPQMSPPYDSALIQMLSLIFWTFYVEKKCFFVLRGSFWPPLGATLRAPGAPSCPGGPPGGQLGAPSMGYPQHMTQYPFSCMDTNFWLDILKNMAFEALGWFFTPLEATPCVLSPST